MASDRKRIEHSDLIKKLFGTDDVPKLDSWREPNRRSQSRELKIDKAIWDLEDGAAMRGRADLHRSLNVPLHYDVRLYLLDAILDAQRARVDWEVDQHIRQVQSSLAKDAQKAQKRLSDFLLRYDCPPGHNSAGADVRGARQIRPTLGVLLHTPKTPRLRGAVKFDGELWKPASGVSMGTAVLRDAINFLKFVENEANEKSDQLTGQGPTNHEMIAFVEWVGRYFFFLTGCVPTGGDASAFGKFLNGACNTVGIGTPSSAQLRTLMGRMREAPAWEQFSRDGPDRPIILPRTREEQMRYLERLAACGHPEVSAARLSTIRLMNRLASK
jgi:hypothetical protein